MEHSEPDLPSELRMELETHPCYRESAHKEFARIHIPVAPRCNIQCNYCSRRYDCVNESRPGVTSEVLTPVEAVEKIRKVKKEIPYLSVIGIAGPGDSLANEQTFEALALIREEFPDLTLCLSTNGLLLPQSVDRLKELGVKFITVTINAIDPEIGSKVYDWVSWKGKRLRGVEGAEMLIRNQLEGIEKAANSGMLVKANIVMMPEVNADHIPVVAEKVKELGAYIVNILPLIPVPGTKFEDMRAPSPRERKKLQDICEEDIRQMRHCRMCRADAIGLLGEDRSAEFARETCALASPDYEGAIRVEIEGKAVYRVAVASSDGENIDLHFGQADTFRTYRVEDNEIVPTGEITVETYKDTPMFGEMHRRKLQEAVNSLKDMDIVLATAFGKRALEELRRSNIAPFRESGELKEAVARAVEQLFDERIMMME